MCVSLIASPLPGRFSRRKTQTYRPRVVLCWPFAGKGYRACLPSPPHTRGQVCKCVCVCAWRPPFPSPVAVSYEVLYRPPSRKSAALLCNSLCKVDLR